MHKPLAEGQITLGVSSGDIIFSFIFLHSVNCL